MEVNPDPSVGPSSDPLVDPLAKDWEKQWATFLHLTGFVLPVAAALVMWGMKRRESPFVDDHGKEAVNFQITLLIYGAIVYVLKFIFVGHLLGWPLAGFGSLFALMAAVAAGKGRYYRYPMCLRMIQ